ncbi:aminotransferase class III-fold pyridoxal phosphate-dependent enzyme, partial [bacterium]|nr:aminotransferase class III-fold pyridoxal phosphate-dependent enzyme [bacterium]
TGKMFACEHHDVYPDILCLAKSIAGGIPMGVTCWGDKVGALPGGAHGTTFGGNPLVCAAGLAALKYIEDYNLVKKSEENGKYFLECLKNVDSKIIREVRGIGLMIGIELKKKSFEFVRKLLEHRVLAAPAGATVLRFLPPLVIEKEQIDEIVKKVEIVLQ